MEIKWEKLYASDHYPQVVDIALNYSFRQPKHITWQINKADWAAFSSTVNLEKALKFTNANSIICGSHQKHIANCRTAHPSINM